MLATGASTSSVPCTATTAQCWRRGGDRRRRDQSYRWRDNVVRLAFAGGARQGGVEHRPRQRVASASLASVKVESRAQQPVGADDQHFAGLAKAACDRRSRASSRSDGSWMRQHADLATLCVEHRLGKEARRQAVGRAHRARNRQRRCRREFRWPRPAGTPCPGRRRQRPPSANWCRNRRPCRPNRP